MVFSSSLFIFAFLPVTYILYNLYPSIKVKNLILTVASLIFYSFGRLDWMILLLISVLCNYIAGLCMLKGECVKKATLIISVIVNLGILCVFKYMNFFTRVIDSVSFIDITPTSIALPIGISFFTFQGMSYVFDVYKTPSIASKDFSKVLLYIIFFPQLIAGPIVRYADISSQIDLRKSNSALTASGIKRFVKGLVKKLFLANAFGQIADAVYGADISSLASISVWLGVICYSLQIYYDFSSYSDMAIGLGKVFGFKINENFNHPYCADSIKDFWRRWHISLSSWFKNYLYIPLGGNRHGKSRARINRLIVFFFTGMWHGANWTFILWGLWHGLFLLAEDIFAGKTKRIPVLNRIYTLFVVCIGFMLFRSDNIGQALIMLKEMFTDFSFDYNIIVFMINLLTPYKLFMLLAGIIFTMPVGAKLKSVLDGRGLKIPYTLELIGVLCIFILCVIKLAASSFNPFIYTQF